jgi:glycosyltransferase involved in cell wall biosynthesis
VLHREPNPWLDVQAAFELARLFRKRRYEVVHTHSGKAGILGRLAARWAGVPVIVHTIHGPSFYPYQNPLGNWLFRWLEQMAAEWTTHFVAVADAMAGQYQAAGIAGKYVTIRSGIDLEAFACATPIELPAGPVVGKIARFFDLKGHEFLLAAAPRIVAEVPAVKFLLVGDGVHRERFEQRARQIGLRENFVFTGLVSPAAVPRYIAAMDVLVHLSLREGLPRALPQALAAGKPVVAFDVDGAGEVCRDGETGFLVRAEDVTGLAEAVIRLLQDQALAAKMGALGRQLVRQEYGVEMMVTRLEALYRQLLGRAD